MSNVKNKRKKVEERIHEILAFDRFLIVSTSARAIIAKHIGNIMNVVSSGTLGEAVGDVVSVWDAVGDAVGFDVGFCVVAVVLVRVGVGVATG